MGCTRCANCERGRGCPFGLTTTDPELTQLVDPEWGAERLGKLYTSFALQFSIRRQLGLASTKTYEAVRICPLTCIARQNRLIKILCYERDSKD